MQLFKSSRNRSQASIDARDYQHQDGHHRHHHQHQHKNNHSVTHNNNNNNSVAFAVDSFTETPNATPRRVDTDRPSRYSLLVDDEEPPEGHDHRHPAHRQHSTQLSLDQPTISIVAPTSSFNHSHLHHEARSFDTNDLDQSSAEHSWSSPSARSSPWSEQDQQSKPLSKLKKRGIFSLHSSSSASKDKSSASSSSSSSKVPGRSLSVRHKAPGNLQNQHQQLLDRRRPSEPYLEIRQEHGVRERDAQPSALVQQISSYGLQPTNDPGPFQHSNASPLARSPREPPPSSIPRVTTDPADTNNPFGQHHQRAASGDSFPSQVSSQQPHHMPSYYEELQPPSPLHSSFHRDPPLSHHPAHVSNFPDPALWNRRSPQPESGYLPVRSSSQQSTRPSPPLPPQQTLNSDLLVTIQASSRRPSQQPVTLPPHLGDMTATDRPAGSTQPSPMIRRDSQAVQAHSPYPQGASQGSSFKANVSQQNLQEQQHGRETPPSAAASKAREDLDELDIGALVQKHEELQAKYTKVKRYYFEKEAQVQQLQNTVAHQRMAVSRTVLDDNEYTARFSRLDGAIKDLAFSIRKDWRTIPTWLQPYVNDDAVAVGTKEMTAVGRAVISRWIVDEIFSRHFHPGLETNLSIQLRSIELNLRRHQVQVFTDEDKDNQVARISNWRRTTLDGLSDVLQAPSAQEYQTKLTETLIEKLSASLGMSLKEPTPPEIEQGARMIVENAMGIAEKIPLEARDIVVEYFVPGTPLSESTMKTETGIPALTRPMAEEQRSSTDRGSLNDDVDMEKEGAKDSSTTNPSSPPQVDGAGQSNLPTNREQRKKYVFGNFISKKTSSDKTSAQQESTRPGSSTAKDRDESEKQESRPQARIRFASFMTVEVRGKGPNNVLIKAPVYAVE